MDLYDIIYMKISCDFKYQYWDQFFCVSIYFFKSYDDKVFVNSIRYSIF